MQSIKTLLAGKYIVRFPDGDLFTDNSGRTTFDAPQAKLIARAIGGSFYPTGV